MDDGGTRVPPSCLGLGVVGQDAASKLRAFDIVLLRNR
ncbi:hypothetical protein ART_2907 [Arthrobacter sp. PAMC 25486]|nr:hypothetical protein ART_2907 [Arthrobacter sp. PAMC 25486]